MKKLIVLILLSVIMGCKGCNGYDMTVDVVYFNGQTERLNYRSHTDHIVLDEGDLDVGLYNPIRSGVRSYKLIKRTELE